MASRRRDDNPGPSREPSSSRLRIGRIGSLTWTETCVLKAACDVALRIGEWRLSVDQIEDQLTMLGITRDRIEAALDPIFSAGYISLDDAPENSDVVVHILKAGFEAYAYTFLRDYGVIQHKVWSLVARGAGSDAYELASLADQPELLVDHILDRAQDAGLLRLSRRGYYTVVTEVRPQLRRLVSGIA